MWLRQSIVRLLDYLASLLDATPAPPLVGIVSKPLIAVINESTVVTDENARPTTQALQIQVSNHFAPSDWNQDGTLVYVPHGQKPPKNAWWLVVLDNSDQAGALGYHDIQANQMPIGKVFAKTDLQYGNLWSVTASHELLEQLGDPGINESITGPDGLIYAREVADATESDKYAYNILVGGQAIKVSDFVYKAWFGNAPSPKPGVFDYCGHAKEVLQILDEGYIGVLNPQGSGWGIKTSDLSPKTLLSSRPPVGSRRDRRRTPREHWIVATAHQGL